MTRPLFACAAPPVPCQCPARPPLTALLLPRFLSFSSLVRRCESLTSLALSAPPGPQTVRSLDDISDEVCRTLDAAEFCRATHRDARWRDAAERACLTLGGYVQRLNTHEPLCERLGEAIAAMDRDGYARRSKDAAETVLVANMLLRDFERFGVQLRGRERLAMDSLIGEAQRVGYAIGRNLADPNALGTLTVPRSLVWAVPASLGGALSDGSQPRGAAAVPRASIFARDLVVSADPGSLELLLRRSRSEAVRRLAQAAKITSPAANAELIDRLVVARREIARLAGKPSYAHYQLAGFSLAERPEAAEGFLRELTASVRPAVAREAGGLLRQEREAAPAGDAAGEASGAPDGAGLPPGELPPAWDVPYLEERARLRLPRSERLEADALDRAFSLEGCIRGLRSLLRDVLGVRLDEREMQPGESWGDGVRVFEARDAGSGRDLGLVYLDLLARPGKAPGAAHYVLRCGRRAAPCGKPALPALALAASLPRDRLGPDALELLFHEAGHALHTLLSRTVHQHLSGTRGPLDMMEIPSHVIEAFARTPHGLAAAAGGWEEREGAGGESAGESAGESSPPFWAPPAPRWRHAAEMLRRQRRRTPALTLARQVALSRADLVLHGPSAPTGAAAAAAVADIFADCIPLPQTLPPEELNGRAPLPHARLGHIVGYGATYFSYLYAQALAARLWATRLGPALEASEGWSAGASAGRGLDGASGAADALPPIAAEGRRLAELLMRPGGALPAVEHVQAVFGDDRGALERIEGGWAPNPSALLAELGITDEAARA